MTPVPGATIMAVAIPAAAVRTAIPAAVTAAAITNKKVNLLHDRAAGFFQMPIDKIRKIEYDTHGG